MTEATFRHGNPTMVDYTAGADIAAGQIVVGGNTTSPACKVAHVAIANGALDAVSIGGGVYKVKVASNYAAHSKVYWDDTNSVLTTTSTNFWLFGYTLEAAAAANAVIDVWHWPVV